MDDLAAAAAAGAALKRPHSRAEDPSSHPPVIPALAAAGEGQVAEFDPLGCALTSVTEFTEVGRVVGGGRAVGYVCSGNTNESSSLLTFYPLQLPNAVAMGFF